MLLLFAGILIVGIASIVVLGLVDGAASAGV